MLKMLRAPLSALFLLAASCGPIGDVDLNQEEEQLQLDASSDDAAINIDATQNVFGEVEVGQRSTAIPVLVLNNSKRKTLAITAFIIAEPFSAEGPNLPVELAPGESVTAEVYFAPTNPGAYQGVLQIESSKKGRRPQITFTGVGVAAVPESICGDGALDSNEECDDGNNSDGDGCSANCTVEAVEPFCGDGVLNAGETCDDGNNLNGDGCSAACTVETPTSFCGNGVLDTGEACDDGNNVGGDGCSASCEQEINDQGPAVIWSSDLEDLSGWTAEDLDGDGATWFYYTGAEELGLNPGQAFASTSENANPDNVVRTPSFLVPQGAQNVTLKFRATTAWDDYEHMTVYLEDANTTASLDFVLKSTSINSLREFVISVPGSFTGREAQVAVRHHNILDRGWLLIDDFEVSHSGVVSTEGIRHIWSTDFEAVQGWMGEDSDGDGYYWFQNYDGTSMGLQPGAYLGSYSTTIAPDHYILSPTFFIPADAQGIELSMTTASSHETLFAETIGVYIVDEASQGGVYDHVVLETTLTDGGINSAVRLSGTIPDSFAGKGVQIAIRHFNSADQFYLAIDDLLITCAE